MSEVKSSLLPNIGKPVLSAQMGEDKGLEQQVLLMGIDLGTSRSSIVTMDGRRKTCDSYIGFAKDAVSRKFLKTDILYGRAALDNRLAVDLYRPLEKGVIKGTFEGEGASNDDPEKNIEAAKLLVRHLVDLVHPERDQLLYGVVGVPSLASAKNKKAMIDACKDTLDAVMLVSEPFTVAYGMERMSGCIVIDIGAGTTDLCRMHGTVPGPDDEITNPVAGDAVDLKLYDLIKAKFPQAQLTHNMCKQFKEQYGYVSDTKDKIIVQIPVDGKPTPHDITDVMKEACELLVPLIVAGVKKLVASFNPEFQEQLRQNVILSGGGGMMRGLSKRVEDGLVDIGGAKVNVVEEPLYAGANGALQLAVDMPSDFWEKLR